MCKWVYWGALVVGVIVVSLLWGSTGFGVPTQAIFELRLLRVATGFVVGASLACAGAVMQAVLRNPLAEPYVLGISSGAGLGAAAAVVCGALMPLGSLVGGGAAMALVYLLASGRRGEPSVYLLILCGAIVAAMFSSLLMVIVSLSDAAVLQSITWWMMGGLQFAEQPLLIAGGCVLAVALIVLIAQARTLDAFALGSETAHHLGVRVAVALPLLLLASTVLTAMAVALSGLIGFVGLVVPHVLRRLTGCRHRLLLPICALFGGVFLVACDTLARSCLPPQEIPVGVVTALCGGPFFLWQLCRRGGAWRL